jgi:hypothetical protein
MILWLKNMDSHQYYYSKNGEPAKGPFNLVQLLERVDKDHLIWRDGIDWTPVTEVPELVKFFSAQPIKAANKSGGHSSSGNYDQALSEILMHVNVINDAGGGFKKLYTQGRIDLKKWGNFTKNFAPTTIGSMNDCLVYYDNTMFGKGDDGFLFTKQAFCWKNLMESGLNTWNRHDAPNFSGAAETVGFKVHDSATILVVNKASEHLVDGGFRVSCNFVNDKAGLVEQLNKLLRLVKQN